VPVRHQLLPLLLPLLILLPQRGWAQALPQGVDALFGHWVELDAAADEATRLAEIEAIADDTTFVIRRVVRKRLQSLLYIPQDIVIKAMAPALSVTWNGGADRPSDLNNTPKVFDVAGRNVEMRRSWDGKRLRLEMHEEGRKGWSEMFVWVDAQGYLNFRTLVHSKYLPRSADYTARYRQTSSGQ